ncbi:hypothetical protein MHB77_31955 [Paenibacillus sp. FSL K6-3166]|uniref:hypothetical protein n=1 Tax=unclassified Paenibacillus TaxID=185978 RepID=UPI000BA0BB67|nr:hypothetical protein [Paenibacillus sp. VTT E-133291]OZQ77335.1 hypothetical protein CA598_29840 [Paenibacillus sp. VTT E-133291]
MPEGKNKHVTFRCDDDQLTHLKGMKMGTRSAYIREAIDFFEKKEDINHIVSRLDSLELRIELKLNEILQKIERRAATQSGFNLINDKSTETTKITLKSPLTPPENEVSEQATESQNKTLINDEVMYFLGE